MSITINERLNLVVPLESGKGYVHCPPLSRDAFALCWKLLARTWSSLESDELGITAGAAVAAFALKEQAEQAGPEGETTYTSLLADINRNATYIGVSDEGFDPIPLSSALKKVGSMRKNVLKSRMPLFFYCRLCAASSKEKKSLSWIC